MVDGFQLIYCEGFHLDEKGIGGGLLAERVLLLSVESCLIHLLAFADAFQAGWNYIAIKNVETGALVDTPHLLLTTDKKRMKWSYKGVEAQVVYKESRNKKTGAVKGVLVYKYNGDMPRTIGIYYAPAP